MLPAIIGGIASIGSALIGGHGQSQANESNAQQAKDNRDFQERMRATQYQTAVEDMRKAGLNPALAYQQGGAGTPSGAQAQMQNTAAGAGTAAADAFRSFQDMRRTNAEIERTTAETDQIRTATQVSGQDLLLKILAKETGYRTFGEALERIKAEARGATNSANEAQASARIRQLAIPEAEAIAGFYKSAMGKLDPYINSGAGAAGALGKLIPFLRASGKPRKLLPRINRDHSIKH